MTSASEPPARHAVIVASIGRAELLAATVARLARQTRRPNLILIVSVTEADVVGVAERARAVGLSIEVHFAPKGLPVQRNVGLARLGDRADYVTFFDDDFVAADDYLAILDEIYAARRDVVGITGRLVADGINNAGYSYDDALARLAADVPPADPGERTMPALYGCNMSYRCNATAGIRFDEALPLYGWQEDVDFSFQVGQRGRLLRTERLAGVHMGAKGGRTSGRRLGYSQIANPVYLLRKRTIPKPLAWRLMRRNLVANLAGSLWSEPHIDRRGRFVGNLLALRDLAAGRLHPGNILAL
ncbi:hypothetical protein IP88_03325 [alpha proteobacterium AAP81b]|nr:hypothetical protein IP88_03325 [alpha proteobacterium AAP81b]